MKAIGIGGSRFSEVMVAAAMGELGSLERLATGPSVYQRGAGGKTALHLASELGRDAAVQFLCERFPRLINQPDDGGRPPLILAVEGRHLSTTRVLCNFADVNLTALGGESALMVASAIGWVEGIV